MQTMGEENTRPILTGMSATLPAHLSPVTCHPCHLSPKDALMCGSGHPVVRCARTEKDTPHRHTGCVCCQASYVAPSIARNSTAPAPIHTPRSPAVRGTRCMMRCNTGTYNSASCRATITAIHIHISRLLNTPMRRSES